MKCLVIGDYDATNLKPSTACLVQAASKIGGTIDVVLLGNPASDVLKASCALKGVTSVVVLKDSNLNQGLAEPCAQALLTIAKDYTHILASSTTYGKNIAPRLAAQLGVGQISDVISVESPTVFKHPIYAGNVIATVESLESIHVMTVRPTAFDSVESGGSATLSEKTTTTTLQSQFVTLEESKSDRPDLTAAAIVVSGGRALQSKENFHTLIDGLADDLGAAIGASRAAVDAGYVANECQVGQTGKVVAPNLYIAIGISGAIQHLAGMKDSKVIVAINKDPDAPIFQIADYGLVGDLFELIPELRRQLKEKKAS